MLSQSLSHDDHRHIVTIFLASSAQPRLAIPTGTFTDEGISAINEILHLHVSAYIQIVYLRSR